MDTALKQRARTSFYLKIRKWVDKKIILNLVMSEFPLTVLITALKRLFSTEAVSCFTEVYQITRRIASAMLHPLERFIVFSLVS